ncbi:Hypothetical_protein [Hexamita inflata]|uniref:Hypothetical_protein n=1 Tax=Hexamita inflata TaxID=28002 RepID=A0ABP1J5W7_9EUKA
MPLFCVASWILVLSIFQNINISMLKPNSSILSWRLPFLLKLRENISRSYFLIITVCNRIQYFSNPVTMKYFWKTNYHRYRCSVATSWILVLSIFQNINISMLKPNQVYYPGVFC